jgi:PAS domain S-box-containing protein
MADQRIPDPQSNRPRPAGDQPVSPAEAFARLSGTRLADFFSNVPATVWMTDERMVLTFVQGIYLRRLQLDPAKVIGRTIPEVLLDGREDHPLIQGHLTALSGHETTVRVEWGGRLYNVRLGPLRDADDRVVGCVGVHLEIGWLPDDDGTLRESDVRLRRVVDSNMMGIAFGDDQGRITDANDAFLDLIGYAREDLVGDLISWPSLMPVETHQRQILALEEILATGRCSPFETEVIRRDGAHVSVLVGAARLSAQRREGVAFVLDISDRKRGLGRLRAELACADALAEARTLGDAAGPLLNVLRVSLSWRSAALWRSSTSSPEGWQLVARDGEATDNRQGFESLLEKILATREEVWSASQQVMALPLVARGRCLGALILAGGTSDTPDAEFLQTCRRIADRIAKFIDRNA